MSRPPTDTTPPPMRLTFPCWGDHVVVAAASGAALDTARAQVSRIVRAFELACSSLRGDSELARLNAYAGDEVVVSALLFLVVRESLRAARWTGGVVDPTVGRALIAHRADRGASGQTQRAGAMPGHARVRLEPQNRIITLPADLQLDLGATAKAMAADTAAAAASTTVGCGVLVGIRGDVAVAGRPPAAG